MGLLADVWKIVHADAVIQWVLRRVRLIALRVRSRRRPLDESVARAHAQSVLMGKVERAVAFAAPGRKGVYIAGLWKQHASDPKTQAFVLEPFGRRFRRLWSGTESHELLYGPREIIVDDVDGDGIPEVIFSDRSFGSGAGCRSALVYSLATGTSGRVNEFLNWQAPAEPASDLTTDGDPSLVRTLEKAALRVGMLQGAPISLEKPEFAVQRWHSDNGTTRAGKVLLHWFPGRPGCRASIGSEIDVGDLIWIAYFKGPLCAYSKSRDAHFIAYSDAWSYNWTTCLAFDGTGIWFGVHSDVGVLSFRLLSETEGQLSYLTRVGDLEFPEVHELEWRGDSLFVNGRIRIRGDVARASSSPLPR